MMVSLRTAKGNVWFMVSIPVVDETRDTTTVPYTALHSAILVMLQEMKGKLCVCPSVIK